MTSVLVTGVAGFIGSNLVRNILETTNWSIIGLDAIRDPANRESITGLDPEIFSLFELELSGQKEIMEVAEGQDVIIHLAAEAHNDQCLIHPKKFVDSNVLGTFHLLESARQFDIRLHHVSTDEVFGDLPLESNLSFSGSSPCAPSSPHSATKTASDHLMRAWVRSFGIAATISNCSNNYGKFQHIEKFIPRQITNILSGIRPNIYGSGQNVRDWIHVDDHEDALKLILEKGNIGETYLIGTNGEMSNLEVLKILLEATGRQANCYDTTPDRPSHDLRYSINSQKLKSELGWNPPKRDFSNELMELVNWYSLNRSWWGEAMGTLEGAYRKEGT